MAAPVKPRDPTQPSQSASERSKKPTVPTHRPVSPPESDDNDSSTEEEEDDVDSDGDNVGTAQASPDKSLRGVDPKVQKTAAPTAPAMPDGMLMVSESKLRDMMRQEIENLLKTLQAQKLEAPNPVGESKPLQPVRENEPVPNVATSPRTPLAGPPFQASVADVPEPTTSYPREPIGPLSRHASMSSAGRAGSISGTANSPHSPSQSLASVQSSIIDEKWGRLFDQNGQPTGRADDVFRSVADYIIANYQPLKSIVVTPEKLARFYTTYHLPNELFAFATLFSPRTMDKNFYERIADLYEDLGCQYHLVQKDTRDRPVVPGLTPTGFARWLIANIQAYPDEEAKRLDSVVLDVPLSVTNPSDGKPERMPRMISRNLLPEQPDVKARKILDEALKDFIDDTDTAPSSPSVPRPLGLSIPASSSSARDRRYPAAQGPPNRDPNKYRPVREYYPDRSRSFSTRRDSRESGPVDSGEWSPGGSSAYSRHSSIAVSPAAEKDKLPLPPPPVGHRNRSPQSRRYSHSAVNIMQSHPPTSAAGGVEPSSAPTTGGLLSPTSTYPPASGGGAGLQPPMLSPEQLATIRDRSPRRERGSEYYNLHRQASYVPGRASRGGADGGGAAPGQAPRGPGPYRDHRGGGDRESSEDRSQTNRRRSAAAADDPRGQAGWGDYFRNKGA